MMRRSILRPATLLACTVMVAAFLAVPTASAQTAVAPLAVEQPIVCGTSLFGRISGGVGPYAVSYRLQGIVDLMLPPITVAAAGAFQSPGGYMNAVPYGSYMMSVTVADSTAQQATAVFSGIVSDTCSATAAGSSSGAAATGGTGSVPAGAAALFIVPSPSSALGAGATLPSADQPFLAQAAAVPPTGAAPAPAPPAPAAAADPALAATGSKADLPMMIGSVLVAAGAAFIANEKRRHRWS